MTATALSEVPASLVTKGVGIKNASKVGGKTTSIRQTEVGRDNVISAAAIRSFKPYKLDIN